MYYLHKIGTIRLRSLGTESLKGGEGPEGGWEAGGGRAEHKSRDDSGQ